MTVHELAAHLNITPDQVNRLVQRRILPPPIGRTRNATYGQAHIAAYHAYRAVIDHNIHLKDAVLYCQEEGISLPTFVATALAHR